MYDIFYLGVDDEKWRSIKTDYPVAIRLDKNITFADIKKKAFTKHFWVIWDDLVLTGNLDIPEYRTTEWDDMYVHIFKNGELYDGISLIPKNIEISEENFKERLFSEKKEIDIQASFPKKYDIFEIDSYEEYLKAMEESSTDSFWMTSRNISIDSGFKFNIQKSRLENHAFIHRVGEKDYFNGVLLLSKLRPLSKKEIDFRFPINRKEWPIVASGPVKYDVFDIETYDDYLSAMETSRTEMFWMTSPNLKINDEFNFDIYFSHNENEYERKNNHSFIHRVEGKDLFNGVHLLSKHKPVSKKEIEHRYLIDKKEWPVVASGPVKYDIFDIETYDDYLKAIDESKTELFWMTSPNLKIDANFNFDIYFSHDKKYERYENHSFIHRIDSPIHKIDGKDLRNGVFLMSKYKPVSKREIDYRFLIDKKEWDIVASGAVKYDIFEIETYDDYLKAIEESKTEMFWMTSKNIKVDEDFKFDLYFPHDMDHDRNENHAFIHRVGDEDLFNGVFLLSKHKTVSKKEINHRFLVKRKEWPIVASGPVKYDVFDIETYDDYLSAMETSRTEMFWMTSPNLDTSDCDFDLYFPHNKQYERYENHSFIHRVNGKDLFNGVHLLSTHKPVSKKEIEHRFLIEKKEWSRVVSGPAKYDIFEVEDYEDYLEAFEKSRTEMFYLKFKELDILDSFKFDTYFSHDNKFDRTSNHAFKHIFRGEETFNGLILASKAKKVSKKEVNFRYFIERKEHDIIASKLKLYDIVFVSYDEPNADENYKRLITRFPRAKRVHGIKGIHHAHIEAAKLAETEMMWVVDGDAVISQDFNFDYEASRYEVDAVHVWRSQNPVNDLIYGYGGVKLLPRKLTLDMDLNSPDMTTSISKKFIPINKVSNITQFNTDPFNTWKSAFRECVKLSSKIIARQKDEETLRRLEIWCTVGKDSLFGEYSISGALAGKQYGENTDDVGDLSKINDFDWLMSEFKKNYE